MRVAKGNARTAKSPCPSLRVSIIYRSVDDLKLDPKNPRSHRPRQVRQIARSIVEFGFLVPILIDASGKVIAGHGRLLAARQLGWREVPTIQLHHLSEAQARVFMIADNRLTEISEWDDALLATQLRELAALDLDFSLENTGFDAAEIDLRIGQSVLTDDDDERANQIPESSGDSPVTQTGDVWILNEHRVLCASALERNSYTTLMGKDGPKWSSLTRRITLLSMEM
jgi:ParB-like nuclease domain